MAKQDFTVFEIKIPTAVMPLIEYAAKAEGWQPTLAGGEPNPESAVSRLFAQTVRVATSQAINALAAEKANEARNQAVEQMNSLSQQWLDAMVVTQ